MAITIPVSRPVLYPPASDLVRSQRQRPSRSRQEPAPVPVLNPSRSRRGVWGEYVYIQGFLAYLIYLISLCTTTKTVEHI